MDIPLVQAARRGQTGTRSNRRLRAEGQVPAVLYGKGQENVNLQVAVRDADKLFADATPVVELEVDGGKGYALVRSLQCNHLGDQVQHLDFARVELSDYVSTKLPLNFVGSPKGSSQGGLLEIQRAEVPLKCLARAIPKSIEVEVTHLDVGDSVLFKDLNLPEGAELLANPDGFVVSCRQARRAAALAKAAELDAVGKGPAAKAAPAAGKKK